MKIAIDQDVLTVLQASTITDTELRLPDQRLAATLYQRINKVLVAAGGKWDRKRQAHLFTRDPRPVLGLALAAGTIAPTIVDVKKQTQAYYTPFALAKRLLDEHLSLRDTHTVLEPSAGSGSFALAAATIVSKARIKCVELDPVSVEGLRQQHFDTEEGDFLKCEPASLGSYNAVVMNPPFTGGQDISHVEHAWSFLRPGGELLAIMAPGFEFQLIRRATAFRLFLSQYGEVVERLPAGTFKESGTMVSTVVVRLRRPPLPALHLF